MSQILAIQPLWAAHLSDGILTPAWTTAGFAGAGLLVAFGAWRVREEQIPKIALLTAAFFVAGQIRVPVGGQTSVHLLLVGLLGVLLGRHAAVAIPVGLLLQYALFSHGGLQTLGINSCVQILPALFVWRLFRPFQRFPWKHHGVVRALLVGGSAALWLTSLIYGVALLAPDSLPTFPAYFHAGVASIVLCASSAAVAVDAKLEQQPEFPIGLLLGELAVLATILLQSLVLWRGGETLEMGPSDSWLSSLGWTKPSDPATAAGDTSAWYWLALFSFLIHLPIAAIEGVILGIVLGFLARVKPEMLDEAAGAHEVT